MNVLRKTEREAALDLLPIWAKKMNEISERERDRILLGREEKCSMKTANLDESEQKLSGRKKITSLRKLSWLD